LEQNRVVFFHVNGTTSHVEAVIKNAKKSHVREEAQVVKEALSGMYQSIKGIYLDDRRSFSWDLSAFGGIKRTKETTSNGMDNNSMDSRRTSGAYKVGHALRNYLKEKLGEELDFKWFMVRYLRVDDSYGLSLCKGINA
jgi:hypothetical protein